jgi:hypothetical protein
MRKIYCLVLKFVLLYTAVNAESFPINKQLFFVDENVIEVTLTTDIKKLRADKKEPTYQPANIVMRFADSSLVSEEIRIQPRGEFRKNNCDIASLLLNFKNSTSPKLSPLKKLKLVGGCQSTKHDEELLLKEYATYKIYNFLSVMSFRVRLLHVNYKDSRQKVKPYSQYAFLIEDVEDVAERNNCIHLKNDDLTTEATNRQQMTLISLFQYMIGNTDWSVPKCHNVKLVVPKTDTTTNPYVIPYDFDYSGLVNAAYAVPPEQFNIKYVTERVYRGFPRTMAELEDAIDVFKERKGRIMYYINNFELFNQQIKNEMTSYLEEFYKTIDNKRLVKSVFISNARKS